MSASRNSKKEVSSHNTEVLQDMTRRAKEFYDILNRETNRVCKQVEARDGPGKKLEQNPFPKILKLNVGGHIFLTSLATLHNAPSGNRPFAAKPSRDLLFIKLWAATLRMPEMEKACRKHQNGQV